MQLSCSSVQWYASVGQVDSGKKHRHSQRVWVLDYKSRKFSNKLTLESWIWQPGLLTSHSKSKLMSVLVECGLCFTRAVEGYAWFLSQKQKQVENTWNSFCSIHLWLLVMSVIGYNCQMKIQVFFETERIWDCMLEQMPSVYGTAECFSHISVMGVRVSMCENLLELLRYVSDMDCAGTDKNRLGTWRGIIASDVNNQSREYTGLLQYCYFYTIA